MEDEKKLDENTEPEETKEEVVEEAKTEEPEETKEETVEEEKVAKIEKKESKEEVQKKVQAQIQKKREKEETKPSRILEYLKTEHKWENYVFVIVALATLLLGCLILEGALVVKDNFPIAGSAPTVFAIVLVVIGGLGLLYALWPFFKPALPEFKKITWLTMPKFVGNIIRVFMFILIFVLLFILYDAFISGIFTKIVG